MSEPDEDERTSDRWPPPPEDLAWLSDGERARRFGEFEYEPNARARDPDAIVILGDWVADHIVDVDLPELAEIGRPPRATTVRFHRDAVDALTALWRAWKEAGLLNRVLTFNGAFMPRFKRGSNGGRLSNHAWGTAFDINATTNGFGRTPTLVGQRGCVRELVEIANEHGFFWGGHFRRRKDGMHFEIGRRVEHASRSVGQGEYVVRQGDDVHSIADVSGHLAATIWDDPGNDELRQAGRDLGVLRPGDRVTVPPVREKQESVAAGQAHQFTFGEQRMLRLTLRADGQPRANVSYVLEVAGSVREGTTDGDGRLEEPLPASARRARMTLETGGEEPEVMFLALAGLDPVTTPRGVQARLASLGYWRGPVDGVFDGHVASALRAFQHDEGLSESGEPDESTRERLRQQHGS